MYRAILTPVAVVLLSTTALGQTATPQGSDNAPSNAAVKSGDVEHSSVAASGANSFTEEQARTRITKAGYADVADLKKDDAGLWQATAKKDGKTVHVALDYKGNVTSK